MKSNKFEEFVNVKGVKVNNPGWVGSWPEEGTEVKIGGVIYRVGKNRNYIRISPKSKNNG